MSACPSCALIRRVVIGPIEVLDRDRRVLFAGWWDAFVTMRRAVVGGGGVLEYRGPTAETCAACVLAAARASIE